MSSSKLLGTSSIFSCVTADAVERIPGRRMRPTCFHQLQRSNGCRVKPKSKRFTSHQRSIKRVFAQNAVPAFKWMGRIWGAGVRIPSGAPAKSATSCERCYWQDDPITDFGENDSTLSAAIPIIGPLLRADSTPLRVGCHQNKREIL